MKNNFKRKYFTHTIVSILAVVGIVAAINMIAYFVFQRYDFTQDKSYSLSSASKTALQDLKEKVTINVYFSEKLPPEYLTIRQNVEDLLKEYQTYGGNNLKINYIDPKDNTELQQQLKIKGIPELQFNITEKDQFQVTTGYLGMAVDYLDKEEVLPVVQSIDSFEYDMTSAIKKVTATQTFQIAWAKNAGDAAADLQTLSQSSSQNQKYSEVIKELNKDYQIVDVDLTSGKLLDNNTYKTLVVAGVESELDDKSKYVIDQFIMKGGSVLFMLDGVTVNQNLQAQINKTGLDEMLKNYGVTISPKMVLDNSSEIASFSGGYTNFMVQYPYWVKVTKTGFAKDNAAVSSLESLVLPWVSNVDATNGKPLVQSSNKSWLSGDSINLDPQQDFTSTNFSQYNLAVTLNNSLNSYYQGKDKPADVDTANFTDKTDNARVVVVGDADFVSDTFIGLYPDNFTFLANMLDWLDQNESLISIRSKGVSDRSLKELSDSEKASLKYLNIFGITGIVIILGAVRFILRKKKFKKIKFKL